MAETAAANDPGRQLFTQELEGLHEDEGTDVQLHLQSSQTGCFVPVCNKEHIPY
jgi:hypothetical protein